MSEHERLMVMLDEELQALHDVRDQLLLEVQLEHSDLRGEWSRLDEALRAVRAQVARLDEQADSTCGEIEVRARRLLDEAKAHVVTLQRRHWPGRTASGR
jgi:hypothetical protein